MLEVFKRNFYHSVLELRKSFAGSAALTKVCSVRLFPIDLLNVFRYTINLESQPGLLRTKVYSAFHRSGVGK